MTLEKLHKVSINGSEQWILVRGKNLDAPLVLHVQAGPGLPMICEANTMKRLLDLEENYLVAYWDQRGCGKSFHKSIDPKTINLRQLTDDLIACSQFLLKEYKKDKLTLVGYSIGATISLMAGVKNRSLFNQLFLVGIDIDIPIANKNALDFAMNMAIAIKDKKVARQVTELSTSPITDSKAFQKRAKIIANLGGIKTRSTYNQLLIFTIKNLFLSKAYSFGDIPKTIKGMTFCQDSLLPEFDTLNLFDKVSSVQVPVHFVQGKLDAVAPYQITVRFYEFLKADKKKFTLFENSAHMPHYEEPDKFGRLLKEH